MSDFEKLRKINSFIGPYRRRRVLVTLHCMAEILVAASIPYLLGWMVTLVQTGAPLPEIIRAGLIVLSAGIADVFLDVTQNYAWHAYSAEFMNYFRLRTLRGAFAKSPAYIKERREDFHSQILNDSAQVASQVAVGIPMLLLNGLRIALIAAFMISMSPRLALVVFFVAPVYSVFFARISRRVQENSKNEREAFSALNSSLKEYLRGVFQIKIFRKEDFFLTKFRVQILNFEKFTKNIKRYTAFSYGLGQLVTTMLPIAVLALGAVEVAGGRMAMGALFSFYFYLSFLYEPLNNLADVFNGLQISLGMAERVIDLLDSDREEERDGLPVRRVDRITVSGLTFAYPGCEPTLRGLDFEIEKGDIVGIIGPSGSGKSTLADLLMKIHDDYQGSILADGVELRTLDRASYYARISYLDQAPFLFSGSLRENIAFDDADSERYVRVLNAARLGGIRGSEAPETLTVETAGANLSGGEKQRVALARALYKDADLIVLDEFTSALDEETEAEIVAGIRDEVAAGRMILILTHRKAPLSICNKTIDLGGEKGAENKTEPAV